MKTNIEIDINDYLSEEEKKEISINLFKEELRNGFIKLDREKRIKNYERVITNAVFNYLGLEIDKIIGTDFKKILHTSVKKELNKDLSYKLFRNESPWGDKKSIAQITLDEAVAENKDIAIKKVKEALENLNTDNVEDYFIDVMKEVILKKLKE
jgi:hypothetical protein